MSDSEHERDDQGTALVPKKRVKRYRFKRFADIVSEVCAADILQRDVSASTGYSLLP